MSSRDAFVPRFPFCIEIDTTDFFRQIFCLLFVCFVILFYFSLNTLLLINVRRLENTDSTFLST